MPKQWSAVGGSKADATVRLAYEQFDIEQVQADERQGLELAKSRCAVWGFAGAVPFGGSSVRCDQPGGFSGCRVRTFTREYQCTAQASAPAKE